MSWERPAHPDFVIDQSVLCILVELFLRVNVDAVGSQLFSNLQAQKRARMSEMEAAKRKWNWGLAASRATAQDGAKAAQQARRQSSQPATLTHPNSKLAALPSHL